MELRHLRYFMAAAREENFHRASEILFVTPSSLSRRIKDLEIELGTDLFERHQHRVTLTAAGRAYLEDMSRLFDMLDAANRRARRVAGGEVGALSLAINDTVMRHATVTGALNRFSAEYPEVEVRLEPLTGPSLSEALVRNAADAAFLYTRPKDDAGFEFLRVEDDRLLLAMPRSNPLADRKTIRLADLQDEDFLWLPRENAALLHDSLLGACVAGGLTPHITQRLMNESSRIQLVAAGMGVSFVFESFTTYVHKDVVIRPVEDLNLAMPLEMAWLQGNASSPLANFIRVLKAEIATGQK